MLTDRDKVLFRRTFDYLSKHPEEFLVLNQDYDWDMLAIEFRLPEPFIEEFKDDLNWVYITEYQKNLSESFIRDHADRIEWKTIWYGRNFSESFIREFIDKVNWGHVTMQYELSESFIREYADKMGWVNISRFQKLSESFIEEFADKVDWPNISAHQRLSRSFIRKHKKKLFLKRLLYNFNLSPELKAEIKRMSGFADE